jgi:hypothetical protein
LQDTRGERFGTVIAIKHKGGVRKRAYRNLEDNLDNRNSGEDKNQIRNRTTGM